jgi:uncharacterized protein (DUF305 family)
MKTTIIIISLAVLLSCSDSSTTDHQAHSNTQSNNKSTNAQTIMTIMTDMMDNMKNVEASGNPDNDYATLMMEHHLGAIEMAKLQISNGTDPQIKKLAEKTIKDQQREVAEFKAFLSGHRPHGNSDLYYKEAMSIMKKMNMDMGHTGSVDKEFVQMMIPHHQSAIDMSRAYIKMGDHQTLIKIANNIINSQSKEIMELNNLLSSKWPSAVQ